MRRAPIQGRFAPIRIGLRAHMPKFAQNPAATHLYLWCHLATERTGAEPGVVNINAAELAAEWGWSRGKFARAMAFLTRNPRPDKPWLVRLNAGQRGAIQRYYIRNFEGNDPTEPDTSHVPPTVHENGNGHAPPTVHDEERNGAWEAGSSCTVSCSTSGTTSPKVVPSHAPPTVQLQSDYTRASETTREIRKPQRGFSMNHDGTGSDPKSEYAPRISKVFDNLTELEQHLRLVTMKGLPEHMLDDAVARAMKHPEAYGLGLREADPDDDWQDPFAEVAG